MVEQVLQSVYKIQVNQWATNEQNGPFKCTKTQKKQTTATKLSSEEVAQKASLFELQFNKCFFLFILFGKCSKKNVRLKCQFNWKGENLTLKQLSNEPI